MENTDEIVNRHAVRIAVDDEHAELKGSGVILVRNRNEKALIFTAAHVIDDIWGDNKKEEKNLYLSCTDRDGNWKVIQVKAKIRKCIDKEEIDNLEAEVYIHNSYDKKNLRNDVAVICVPWIDWMKHLECFEIDNCQIGMKQKFSGFPHAMEEDFKKGTSEELEGKRTLSGKANNLVNKRYNIEYNYNVNDGKIKRTDYMCGFSGSGVLEIRRDKIVLAGIVSKPCGANPAGDILWATSGNALLELMEQANIKFNIPNSFSYYIDPAKNTIEEGTQNAKKFFVNMVEKLIDDKDLVPNKTVREDGFFEELKCNGNRKCCSIYWEGQLKKAIILSLQDIPVEQLHHPQIQMPIPYDEEIVNIEYLCTEDNTLDAMSILIKEDYFSNGGKLSDGTIFVWNGKDTRSLYKEITREQCRGIVVDIADSYESTKRCLEKLANFNIIEGQISECNLAMIGIEELMKVITMGGGSLDKMKKKMEGTLKRLWEV